MNTVKIWEEVIEIPTYEVGNADKNPMFLEKRVYQGSSGKVYPYPTTETLSNTKVDKKYNVVWIENQYIKVMIMPELGGRIQRAIDKTNNEDFVYYNEVIKPALVGLIGPWISGGIEFNWPQHHRPTTFMPVDYKILSNEDGSKTLIVHDVDQMYGTKGMAKFTLYPDKSYIEIEGQVYNRTSLPQTFLWWANPAVEVNDYTQSVFPPDVFNVYDHGKRDVSRFPIATGTFYKYDYSDGVDISRYKNVPVPTSYMAENSEFNFVGGYDYKKKSGILHVANHHISPGKKQWTWGCGDFGKAWDRNLTDKNGPYIELMTGVYTDNQPDFTWLKPFEEKRFKQYFMPYKEVGYVKNASIDAMVNLDYKEKEVDFVVYTTSEMEDVVINIFNKNELIYSNSVSVSPMNIFNDSIEVNEYSKFDIKIEVLHNGKILVDYQEEDYGIPEIADPAKEARHPDDIITNEELYLTGLHLEQYRHATFMPDDYYQEGLKRDEYDIRINNAYGTLLLRRGQFEDAKKLFEKAISRLTNLNPNPYNSEPYYNLGLTLFYLKDYKEAYKNFYKATWTNEQQEMSFYYLAAIDNINKNFEQALELINKSLIKNSHNVKARGLKLIILRNLNKTEEFNDLYKENLNIDNFDYLSMFENLVSNKDSDRQKFRDLTRDFHESYLNIARDYMEVGEYTHAIKALEFSKSEKPLIHYYKGVCYHKLSDIKKAKEVVEYAGKLDPTYTFPNKLEDIEVLETAIQIDENNSKAYYYLGNLKYDKLQFNEAIKLWQKSADLDNTYPTVFRNLALGYYNKVKDEKKAVEYMEKAFKLDKSDARVFLELDQLYKKTHVSIEKRFENMLSNKNLLEKRDDLYLEYVTLLNYKGQYKEAYSSIMNFKFRPWEGAEGKVPTQYKISLLEQIKVLIKSNQFEEAVKLLNKALNYPDNLGEGKLIGTKDNHLYYYLGLAYEGLDNKEGAIKAFEAACLGDDEPASIMYYYDQPADMILYQGLANKKLENNKEANKKFYKLLDYGERHVNDDVKIDYFAVSIPDFLIFEDDLNIRNKAHCYYLMGLAQIGLKNYKQAKLDLNKALEFDPNHQNCLLFLNSIENNLF